MLFTFPSRYLFTIGRQGVFSLGGWSPLLPTGFLVSRSTQDSTQLFPDFVYRSVTFFAGPFQTSSTILLQCLFVVLQPQNPWTLVWALSFSLAATGEIDFSFFSSAYLDVSVQRVPFHTLCIGVWMTEVFSAGFPHSDISGSMDMCSSPKLFAAYHVFHRLLVPRHPPCALISLTN